MNDLYRGDDLSIRFSLGVLVASSLYFVFSLLAEADLGRLGVFFIAASRDLDWVISMIRRIRVFTLIILLFFTLVHDPIASLIIILSEATIYFIKGRFESEDYYKDLLYLVTPVILMIYFRTPPPIP